MNKNSSIEAGMKSGYKSKCQERLEGMQEGAQWELYDREQEQRQDPYPTNRRDSQKVEEEGTLQGLDPFYAVT